MKEPCMSHCHSRIMIKLSYQICSSEKCQYTNNKKKKIDAYFSECWGGIIIQQLKHEKRCISQEKIISIGQVWCERFIKRPLIQQPELQVTAPRRRGECKRFMLTGNRNTTDVFTQHTGGNNLLWDKKDLNTPKEWFTSSSSSSILRGVSLKCAELVFGYFKPWPCCYPSGFLLRFLKTKCQTTSVLSVSSLYLSAFLNGAPNWI